VRAFVVQVLEPRSRPDHALAHDRSESVVGAQHHHQRADATVVAVGGDGIDLGGRGTERGQDGRGGDVVIVVGLGSEQVIVRRVAGDPGPSPRRGRGQAITHVPPVDADVLIAQIGARGPAAVASLPVVLVGVGEAVQLKRQLDHLQHVELVPEPALHVTQQRLDVQRQPVKRAPVGRHDQAHSQRPRDQSGP
jgi:hypothetical protein